jgi:hypothetical protein
LDKVPKPELKEDHVRIEIAFEGGQTVGAIVTTAAAAELTGALGGDGAGVFELEAADGTYAIPLRAVVYVKSYARETQIGFGVVG